MTTRSAILWRVLPYAALLAAALGAAVLAARGEPAAPPAPVTAPAPIAPAFVPFVVTQSDYTAVRQFLLEQPTKFALPVLQWLEQREREALVATQKPPEPEEKK